VNIFSSTRISNTSLAGALFIVLGLFGELSSAATWIDTPIGLVGLGCVAGALSVSGLTTKCSSTNRAISLAFVLVALWAAVNLAHTESVMGQVSGGYWCFVIALALAIWTTMSRFAAITPTPGVGAFLYQFLVPGLFGVWLIVLWELITVGLGIPRVLLPPPSLVGEAIASSLGVLAADFRQTIIRAVLPGFVMGNLAGFAIALWADRVPFLRRGLLPVGNLVSAIPIVGIAPIMVMWFGFDWQSKAAVVVIMTFFPMLVNTVAGLGGSSAIELDLMRSIGASHWQTFTRVRLPNALPFIFNALKINSALALIGAIVAEFFGTPIVGIGFRISTEAGRMNMEMVWASIALSAVSGSLFYGLLAVVERRATFWHPSFRQLSAKRL
jgi:NitT/TauT family transport system permease protein